MKTVYLIAMFIIVSLPILYSVYLKSIDNNYTSISSIIIDNSYNNYIFFSLMMILGFIGIKYEHLRGNRGSFYSIYFLTACVLLMCFFDTLNPCHNSYAGLAFLSILLFMISNVNKSNSLNTLLLSQFLIASYLLYVFPEIIEGQIAFLILFITYFVYLHFLEN